MSLNFWAVFGNKIIFPQFCRSVSRVWTARICHIKSQRSVCSSSAILSILFFPLLLLFFLVAVVVRRDSDVLRFIRFISHDEFHVSIWAPKHKLCCSTLDLKKKEVTGLRPEVQKKTFLFKESKKGNPTVSQWLYFKRRLSLIWRLRSGLTARTSAVPFLKVWQLQDDELQTE